MDCPTCGEEIGASSQFCRFCGAELVLFADDFDLKSELQSMDDYEFEHFIADLWEEMGWNCEVSTASNDKGIDVRARKSKPYEQKALIQAKRYGEGNKVGSPAIQQYSSLKHQEDNVDKVIIVTTSSFSRNAEELAAALNVKLIDGDDLVRLVEQTGAEEVVMEYVDFEQEASESDTKTELNQNWEEPAQTTPITNTTSDSPQVTSGEIEFPETKWKKRTAIFTGGFWAVVILIDVLPEPVLNLFILIFWIGLPICMYKDSQVIREVVQWPKYRKLYLGFALLPGFGIFVGPWYLLVRYTVEKGFLSVERNQTSNLDELTVTKQVESASQTSNNDPVAKFGIDHYTDAPSHVKQLKREGKHDTAEVLLLWCINQAEKETREKGYSDIPRWYYKQLGIIYRKDGRYDDEREILERYIDTCNELGGTPHEDIIDRLDRAQRLK